MYIVSCENVLVCWFPCLDILDIVRIECIQDLEFRLCAAVMLPKFSAAKILPNPKFEK